MYEPKRFLTRKELCTILRCSIATVDRGIRKNDFPYSRRVKLNNRVLFPVSILAELERRAEATQKSFGGTV
jgi:predicted DNA-binding transcriptional regulator AlpA